MLLKTTSSHEEGCERHWAVSTKSFIGDDNGNLKAIRLVDLEWKVVDERPASFVEVPGSEREIPCELALLAMGFIHPQHEGLIGQLEVELDEKGNVTDEIEAGTNGKHYYYYYNDKNQLTDIVKYNEVKRGLRADFIFEYDEGTITQAIQVPQSSGDYLMWQYIYNTNGLKQKELCLTKERQPVGRIEYSYR